MAFCIFKKLMRRLSLWGRHRENKEKSKLKETVMPKMKQTLDVINSRLDTVKKEWWVWIQSSINFPNETQKERKKRKNTSEIYNNFRQLNIYKMGVPKGEENRTNTWKKVIVKSFLNVTKIITSQIQQTQ